ncbi:MAG: hypothetical protein HC898_05565 [Phycisphaerales bacterium]|nr:hypothetical protein [Phycisphaerales bacterium]
MNITVNELAERIGGKVQGDGQQQVRHCAALDHAEGHDVVLVHTTEDLAALTDSKAGVVVTSEALAKKVSGRVLVLAQDPRHAYRQALVELHGFRNHPDPGIHAQAFVDSTAIVGELCTIRPFAYLARHSRIGKRCVIYPHCYIGKNTSIGDDCVIYPGVSIYEGCILGNRVVVHSGSVIGHDGTVFVEHEDRRLRLPSAGNVVVEDDVEIGANCTLQRAIVGSTLIAKGVRLQDRCTVDQGTVVAH